MAAITFLDALFLMSRSWLTDERPTARVSANEWGRKSHPRTKSVGAASVEYASRQFEREKDTYEEENRGSKKVKEGTRKGEKTFLCEVTQVDADYLPVLGVASHKASLPNCVNAHSAWFGRPRDFLIE